MNQKWSQVVCLQIGHITHSLNTRNTLWNGALTEKGIATFLISTWNSLLRTNPLEIRDQKFVMRMHRHRLQLLTKNFKFCVSLILFFYQFLYVDSIHGMISDWIETCQVLQLNLNLFIRFWFSNWINISEMILFSSNERCNKISYSIYTK